MSIALAADAVARGDEEGALVLLLARWREDRQPEVADAIEKLGARLAARLPPVAGGNLKAWVAALKDDRPAAMHRILAALPEGNARALGEKMEALKGTTNDPRVSHAMRPTTVSWKASSELLSSRYRASR